MQLTQALTRAVQTRHRHIATLCNDRARTWGEVGARVPRLAAGLRSLGLQPGERLAVLALNSDNYIELLFAAAWADLVLVPLNTRLAVPEIVYSLQDADCVGLVVDDAFVDQVPALRASHSVAQVVHMGDAATPAGMADYEALIARSAPMPDACGRDDALCGIYYTGGTTGTPKGVMLSHRNLVAASINWVATFALSAETRFMHSAGLFHLAGTMPVLAITMAGGTHVCLPKFDVVPAFQAIERHRVSALLLVPTMLNMMLNHPEFSRYDLSSINHCEYGASPIPDAVLAAAIEKLPGWQFFQGYGMTESSALTLSLPWRFHLDGEHGLHRRKAAGWASYGVDVRVVDPEGGEVPRGTPGEVVIRGAQVMLGYWKRPEDTAAVLRDGWMHTGDGAWMDEDGFIYIVDRVKDMIISGGENIYSREVENAVHAHPAVRECAVIGIPDEKWGEAVLAVVALKAGHAATEQALIAHCHTLIANYKCPRRVAFCEALPLSGAGKIMKNVLRAPYWAGKERSVH